MTRGRGNSPEVEARKEDKKGKPAQRERRTGGAQVVGKRGEGSERAGDRGLKGQRQH